MNWLAPVSALLSPIADAYGKNQERKGLKEQAKIKAAVARQDGETQITLTDAEWESLKVEKSDQTWADEYLTVLITAPIALILAGSIFNSFGLGNELLVGVTDAVDLLIKLVPNYQEIMAGVVLAGVGLKVWRR